MPTGRPLFRCWQVLYLGGLVRSGKQIQIRIVERFEQVAEQVHPYTFDGGSLIGRHCLRHPDQERDDGPCPDVPDMGMCSGDEGCCVFDHQAGPHKTCLPGLSVGHRRPGPAAATVNKAEPPIAERTSMCLEGVAINTGELDLQDGPPVGAASNVDRLWTDPSAALRLNALCILRKRHSHVHRTDPRQPEDVAALRQPTPLGRESMGKSRLVACRTGVIIKLAVWIGERPYSGPESATQNGVDLTHVVTALRRRHSSVGGMRVPVGPDGMAR